MNIVAYGGGTNSTALLIGCINRKIPVDLILFADTGGERPETYEYVKLFSDWLVERGYPEIITVKGQQPQQLKDGSLEAECLRLGVLPSRVYGAGSCSMKWKREPQDRYVRTWQPAVEYIKNGGRPVKFIGYDADEPHRADREAFQNDPVYDYAFPLIEWDMGRDECIDMICKAGLPPAGKSACFYCPSSKVHEIKKLARTHPELMERALAMEDNAAESLRNIAGLGRTFSWRDVLKQTDMFEDDYQAVDMACGCYDGD